MDYGLTHDTRTHTWTRARAYVAAGNLVLVEVARSSRERVDEDCRHVARAFQLLAPSGAAGARPGPTVQTCRGRPRRGHLFTRPFHFCLHPGRPAD